MGVVLLLPLAWFGAWVPDDPVMADHAGGGALRFSPDGHWLVSHGSRGIHVWDPATGLEHALDQVSAVPREVPEARFGFGARGKELVVFESGQFLAWDLESGARLRALRGPRDFLIFSLMAPDAEACLWVAGSTGVTLTETATGKPRVLEVPGGDPGSFAFSERSGRVAGSGLASGREAWVRAWEVATGKVILSARVLPPGRSRSLVVQTPPGSLSPDGKILAVLRAPGSHAPGVAGGPSAIQLWEVDSGAMAGELEGHRGQAWGAAFSPDLKRLATWGASDLILWDLAERKAVLSRPGLIHAAAFLPDSSAVALVASPDFVHHQERVLTVVDLATGKDRFTRPPGFIHDLACSPDGKTLALSSDRGILLVDAATGGEINPKR